MINFNEKYKIYLGAAGGALLLFISFLWLQDILAGEQGQIRKFILRGKEAVEAKNILTCADMVSMHYQDKYGNDRQNLIYATKEAFNYYKQIFVHIEKMEIKIGDSKMLASAEIVALAVGQTQESNREKILEGEKGRFRIKLVKEDKKWRLLEIEFFEPITIMGQNIS